MKNQTHRARHHVGLILALVGLMGGATLLGPARPASSQVVASWTFTGKLNTAREFGHTATLLPNGKVLVAGGEGGFGTLNSAELYDPATGTWSITASLNAARSGHTATLLPNGKVLVVGDYNATELYDPATGTWSFTGNLNIARAGHTATLLLNGKVLVAGDGFPEKTTELYDPATGIWTRTGDLHTDREYHTATLLSNGKVLLVAGGYNCQTGVCSLLNTAELYDPAAGTWSITASLNTARFFHTATLLPNGQVLVAGGATRNYSDPTNSAELYDPATGTWSITARLNTARFFHTATLLPNGQVLVAGGGNALSPGHTNSAELYNPATGVWSYTANPNSDRSAHTATPLPNGKVLVAGGFFEDSGSGEFPPTQSSELFDPGTNAIDDTQFFVRQHYLDFLNRQADADGLAYWTNRITECGSDARCIHERRIGVSAAFFVEMEFQETGYYVDRFYKASFGRQPNFAEFTADRANMIGGPNLEANKQAFADQWVQRAAFLAAYSITMSNTEFVNKLFDTVGLTASTYNPQRQQEIDAMNVGRSRALILRDVIEIPDFKNSPDPNNSRYAELKQVSQYNPAFVLMQYFGYLHRDPDRTGYDFWLDVVNNREPNNYRGMVCSFLTSSEYQLRFGSSVTRSNADCGQ
jgi:hypothetical protein